MASKICVTEIISKHKLTLQNEEGKFLKEDRKYFFIYPIIIGLFLSFFVRKPSDSLVNIFAICLSIFIGLFLNLLVLIISFAENKLNIKDKKNRAKLLEHVFYNITYTIIISLICLGILFLANVKLFPKEWTIPFDWINSIYCFKIKPVNLNSIVSIVVYFIFFSVFTHTIMTLLMIVKRIFKLFKIEIDEISKKENSGNKKEE